MILFNLIGFFYLGFPQINFHHPITIQLSREFPTITLMLYFPVVGFMYLVSSSVSLSIIVFYVVAVVQEGITNRIGYDVTRPDAFVWGMQSLSWQAWGGFVAMVAISLWMARRHLADVCRNVFWGQDTVDDREEMISYRTAVYGLLLSLVYVVGWLWKSGMDLTIALLFIAGVLIAYYGITRLVVQAGIYYLTTPVGAQAFTMAIAGTGIGGHNLVALGLSYAWFGDVQSVFMPAAAHGARLAEAYRLRRGMAWALGLAVVLGFVANIYFVLSLCYTYGAGNFGSWYFTAGGGWRDGLRWRNSSFQRSMAHGLEQTGLFWYWQCCLCRAGPVSVSVSLVAAFSSGNCGGTAVDDALYRLLCISGVGE